MSGRFGFLAVEFFSEIRCVDPSSEPLTSVFTYCFNLSFKFRDSVLGFLGDTLRFKFLPCLLLSSYRISRVIAVNCCFFVTFSKNVVFYPLLGTTSFFCSIKFGVKASVLTDMANRLYGVSVGRVQVKATFLFLMRF